MKIHVKRLISIVLSAVTVFALFVGIYPIQKVEAVNYTPNRTIKLTTQSGVGARKITLEKLSDKVGTGKAVTVAGYYKIENYTNPTGQNGYAYSYVGSDYYNDTSADRGNTNGWIRFEYSIASTTAGTDTWVQFGFAGSANGTITLADVTVSDSTGVLYSMAMDADLAAGTFSGTKQSSIWYFSGTTTVVSAVSAEPYMRSIYLPTTGIINPPTVVQNVDTTTKLNALKNASRPQAAWMKVNSNKTISLGSTSVSIYDALNACKGKVIPIFEVSDITTAEYVAKSINNLTYGVIIASSSTAAIKKAASYKAPHVTFAYITNATDAKTIARNTLDCGAHTCVLPSASRATVEYLQQRFLTVMLKRTDGVNDEHCVRGAVDCGANFVVMDGFQKAYDMYAKVTAATYVRRPFVVGHRGMVTNAPENTVEGIREAFNNGADAAEIDIWHTSDKQVVCFHNNTLEGAVTTTPPTKNIPDYTLSELKSYTLKTVGNYAGCKIPTLGEIFTELKKHPGKVLVIEIKTWQAIDDLLQVEIDKYDVADQCVIIGFSENQINLHYAQIPYVGRSQLEITNRLTGAEYDTDIEKAAHAHRLVSTTGAMYSPGYEYSTGAIKYLHAHGISCNLWTANDLTMMKQMSAKGAQFITTDAVASANALRSSLNTMTAQAIFGNATTPSTPTQSTTTTTKPTNTTVTSTNPTTASTTRPTTRPTTAPTTRPTTAPTTVPTTRPTTVQTTPPTTVATQSPNPCAKGHTFQDGHCIYCMEADPNYDPCKGGHTFQNGFCIYCLAEQPGYNPCAKGHTYKNGFCIYCAAKDPNYTICGGGHTFENGFCVYCATPDPDYDPCAKGHTFENGFCVDCLTPQSTTSVPAPTVPQPGNMHTPAEDGGIDISIIILIILAASLIAGISFMLYLIVKKK